MLHVINLTTLNRTLDPQLDAQDALAGALKAAGRTSAALGMKRDAAAMALRCEGPAHGRTVAVHMQLVKWQEEANFPPAENLAPLRIAVAAARVAFGEAHPITSACVLSLEGCETACRAKRAPRGHR